VAGAGAGPRAAVLLAATDARCQAIRRAHTPQAADGWAVFVLWPPSPAVPARLLWRQVSHAGGATRRRERRVRSGVGLYYVAAMMDTPRHVDRPKSRPPAVPRQVSPRRAVAMNTVTTVSQALLDARRGKARVDGAALPSPDYRDALAIQEAVQRQIGRVAAFKVASGPDGQTVIAPIPASRTYRDAARVPVRDSLGVELEIGFEVLAPPGPAPMSDLVRVFRPRVVLELVDTRLTGAGHDPMLKLADMQINDGLVIGSTPNDWDGGDFGPVEARLVCGDRVVIDGNATVPGGSALANLALFCATVGSHCGGLRAGQVVITGSLSGLDYFPPGTDVTGSIVGLGAVRCRLG